MRVYVCVCVCVREREREREHAMMQTKDTVGARGGFRYNSSVSNLLVIRDYFGWRGTGWQTAPLLSTTRTDRLIIHHAPNETS